jgi:hypothetical protein
MPGLGEDKPSRWGCSGRSSGRCLVLACYWLFAFVFTFVFAFVLTFRFRIRFRIRAFVFARIAIAANQKPRSPNA